MLYELQNVILKTLKPIFDQSYEYGVLPEDWKSSVVSAVFKKGKKTCGKFPIYFSDLYHLQSYEIHNT